MAQHFNFASLDDSFFLKKKEDVIQNILEDLQNFLNKKPLKHFAKIRELPDEYLMNVRKGDGYKPYYVLGLPCNPEEVWGGACSAEIHYKSPSQFNIYALA